MWVLFGWFVDTGVPLCVSLRCGALGGVCRDHADDQRGNQAPTAGRGAVILQSAALAERRRDVRVIGVVGMCHFFSHFYQFVLPPLSILIHQSEGYSIESLAFLVSIFYGASFALQLPVGFFVDRFGHVIFLWRVSLSSPPVRFYMASSPAGSGFAHNYRGCGEQRISPRRLQHSERVGEGERLVGPSAYTILPVSPDTDLPPCWLRGSLWGWQTASIVTGAVGLFS